MPRSAYRASNKDRAPTFEVRTFAGLELGGASVAENLSAAMPGGPFDVAVNTQPSRAITSCREASDVIKLESLNIDGTSDDYASFWYHAVRCAALELLQRAAPSRVGHVRALLDRDITTWAPPQLALLPDTAALSKAEEAARRCENWGSFEPSLRVESRSEREVVVRHEQGGARVTYFALGDFDGDGFEDLLLRREAWLDEGSYGESILFLLSRTDHDACVRVARRLPIQR